MLGLVLSTHAEELVIGVEEIDYYPYYHLKEGAYRGFAADLLEAYGRAYGHQIRFRPLPIARLYQELIDGSIDFKFPDHPLWGSAAKNGQPVVYSEPVVGYVDGVLVLPQRQSARLDQIQNVGFVRGFSPWTLMDAIGQGTLEVRELNSLRSLLHLALDGKINGAYFNVAVAQHLLDREIHQPNGLVLADQLPLDTSNYRLSTLRPRLLEEFNAFLSTPTADELRKQYLLDINPE